MEYRLYNNLNSTFFDLVGGKEPSQTKSLGFVVSQSKDAMKLLLSLIFPHQKSFVNKLLRLKWVVHCEAPQSRNKTHSGRADIVIGFYDRTIPVQAIIIEGKSIYTFISPTQTINQLNFYKNSYLLKGFIQSNVTLVALTNIKEFPSNYISNVISITWNDVINGLSRIKEAITTQFVNYLINQSKMKFYDSEILCIPADQTLPLIQKEFLYECPTIGKQYASRGKKKPLYVAFRKRSEFDVLYKVQNVISIDLNDSAAVDALDQQGIYPNIKQRINNYVTAINCSGIKWLFILDYNNSIKLPYPVRFRNAKGMRGHVEVLLADVFNKPDPKLNKVII